jgi:hypothetical protein
MFEGKALNLEIYLSRWIVEDGNYDDFCVGEKRKFALEFWPSAPLTRSKENVTSLQKQNDHSYNASGRLVFATDGVWVIDCGLLAYSQGASEIESGCKTGDFVRGDLKFAVDPFFYFEQYYKIPGIPPLIYEYGTSANAALRQYMARPKTLSSPIKVQNLFSIAQESKLSRATGCRAGKSSWRKILVPYRQVRRRGRLGWTQVHPAGALAIGGFVRSR